MSGTRLQNGYSPKQEAIRLTIQQVDMLMRNISAYANQRLGTAQEAGIHKELELIRERLAKRLPEELRAKLPV